MVLTDVDGVLLDWLSGFKKFLNGKGIKTVGESPLEWCLKSWIKGGLDIKDLVEEYNHSEDFGCLTAFPDALEVLRTLHSEGIKIVAITSCTTLPSAVARRVENLVGSFGDIFDDIICLPVGHHKLDTLLKFPAGSFWIEDKPEGAEEGATAGHLSMLITRPYNVTYFSSDVRKCDTWHEVLERIRGQ